MKSYFKNFGQTLVMLFWINFINLVVTILGIFTMIFNGDWWWDWMTGVYIGIGAKFDQILKNTEKESETETE